MTESFYKELIDTGFLHTVLKPDAAKSAETRLLNKTVTDSRPLWDGKSTVPWTSEGTGTMKASDHALCIEAPARRESVEPIAHYTGYGFFTAWLHIDGESFEAFNRLRCRIKPDCDGFHHPFMTVFFRNDGKEKIPDIYGREGRHDLNLVNREWNDCVWEFPDLPRDKVTGIGFNLESHGGELSGGDLFKFQICDIRLEHVENPDMSLGWQGMTGTISHSTTGYWQDGRKTAVSHGLSGRFELLDESSGNTVFTAEIKQIKNEKGSFGLIDFSGFKTVGRYLLKAGDAVTESFSISKAPYEEAAWKALNFIYKERCGFPVGGFHGFCHGDIVAEHGGKTISYSGGWHDAGDLSQQTLQTAEVVHALFEMSLRAGDDVLFSRRLSEEACWGLDFVLKTRFGDGYRATSAGICRWTNNLSGDSDDETARVHNRSFDNFLMSGVEAYAAFALGQRDTDKAYSALKAAREDYKFALDRFSAIGCESCEEMEHSHNAGSSLYYAAASWAASQLYLASGEDYYASEAERFCDLMLECQDTGDAGLPFSGFFYRDKDRKTIMHFNHQSREHLFIQALYSIAVTQIENPKIDKWEHAMKLYGGYLKAMHEYSEPYGMLPAGVHKLDEFEDSGVFSLLHRLTTYEKERVNYREQLAAGIPVGKDHCVRHFPVWFSFRGNAAVQLSSAKAASIIGRYFGDEGLTEIARDQIYWLSGKNPFAQSMMYGEGSNYACQYAALLGETVGEMPVGIQTRANGDVPYWPMANNATYKEVWMSTVGHWLWVIAELLASDN